MIAGCRVDLNVNVLKLSLQGTDYSTHSVPVSTPKYCSTSQFLLHTGIRVLFRVPWPQYMH